MRTNIEGAVQKASATGTLELKDDLRKITLEEAAGRR
jgi:hypothetical protein